MPRICVPLCLSVLALLFPTIGCDIAADAEHERRLETLTRNGATRAEVFHELGPGRIYEKGTPSWDDLQSFLRRERPNAWLPLRENSTKYPLVIYYTTAQRMTWVFLDEKDVMRAYYVTPQ